MADKNSSCSTEMPVLCQNFFRELQEDVKAIRRELQDGSIKFARLEDHLNKCNGIDVRVRETENWILQAKTSLRLTSSLVKLIIGGNLVGTTLILVKLFLIN